MSQPREETDSEPARADGETEAQLPQRAFFRPALSPVPSREPRALTASHGSQAPRALWGPGVKTPRLEIALYPVRLSCCCSAHCEGDGSESHFLPTHSCLPVVTAVPSLHALRVRPRTARLTASPGSALLCPRERVPAASGSGTAFLCVPGTVFLIPRLMSAPPFSGVKFTRDAVTARTVFPPKTAAGGGRDVLKILSWAPLGFSGLT